MVRTAALSFYSRNEKRITPEVLIEASYPVFGESRTNVKRYVLDDGRYDSPMEITWNERSIKCEAEKLFTKLRYEDSFGSSIKICFCTVCAK